MELASACRDFCGQCRCIIVGIPLKETALERTWMSHIKLAAALCLLSSSTLLNARLPGPKQPVVGFLAETLVTPPSGPGAIGLGILAALASIMAVVAGTYSYHRGWNSLISHRAFLSESTSFARLHYADCHVEGTRSEPLCSEASNDLYLSRGHAAMMAFVTLSIFATLLVLLAEGPNSKS